MDFALRGFNQYNHEADRRTRLETFATDPSNPNQSRPAISATGRIDPAILASPSITALIAYKADLDIRVGFDVLAVGAPDYIDYLPGSPDEQPFVYFTKKDQDLSEATKARFLSKLYAAFGGTATS
ncbi:MAG TPA: hypothetical protein VLE73_01275 [Candidatus Saccharimonadales bacterium]|nr:hypothetical protein [Candidatus Saccharimonadales bacterium]